MMAILVCFVAVFSLCAGFVIGFFVAPKSFAVQIDMERKVEPPKTMTRAFRIDSQEHKEELLRKQGLI